MKSVKYAFVFTASCLPNGLVVVVDGQQFPETQEYPEAHEPLEHVPTADAPDGQVSAIDSILISFSFLRKWIHTQN